MPDLEEFRKAALSSEQPSRDRVDARRSKYVSGDVEISPAEWGSFVDGFGHQHEGWLVNISVTHGSHESLEIFDCRLQGTTTDRDGAKCSIKISVVNRHGEKLIHSVPEPAHLMFKRDLSGAHEGLEITSGDGSVTHLRFRAAARPETLDGILPGSDGLR